MRPFLPLAVALAACGQPPNPTGSTRLDLNDVSYLYPLSADAPTALLRFDSGGEKGALLTRAFFDQVKPVDEELDGTGIYSGMRIISARVDPCFPVNKKGEPLSCKKQVRLVAQIVETKAGALTTRDGTLHLFFDLSDAEWALVVDGVGALKALAGSATDGKPLDVHPVMKAEGAGGAYARQLNALITAHCGAENLSRVAFMVAGKDGKNWNFGAFNRNGAVLEADPIPRFTDKKEQGLEEHGNEERRNSEMVPTPTNIDLTTLLSYTELQLADELTLVRATKEALLIENPDHETPQTIDCASCHVASRALTFGAADRNIDLKSFTEERYVAPARFDVRRVDAAANNPFAQRAFGYFGADTALSQRTINESAVIAEALSPK
ncbi:MAG: hypothetical protein IPJ65_03180 [Archangiaceae bacterium]|nr:hypothetical protein [Archangiaceae bacterium]